jgi:hypothetical protein
MAGYSFTYVAHLVFSRDVWIRTQRAAVASRRTTNFATHLLMILYSMLFWSFLVNDELREIPFDGIA